MKKARTPLLRRLLNMMHQANHELHDGSSAQKITRRKFLEDTSKTTLLLGLASTLPFAACKQLAGKEKRIAIIGAGIAGLHCAYILQKAGIKATIYEADKRSGGRMFSKMDVFDQGLSVEFGGEFIDSNHEDMWNLIAEFGLETLDTHKDTITRETFYFQDRHFSESEVINEFKKVVHAILKDIEACGPYYDSDRAIELDHTPMSSYIDGLNCEAWLKELLNDAYLAEFGLDTEEQSTLNFLDMIDLDTSEGFKVFGDSDERFKVIGGNQKIPDALAEKLKDNIKFEYRLTVIASIEGVYHLTFSNEETVEADIVLLTIPFTILRNIKMEIPEMSEMKMKCIQELGYGQNNKVMLGMSKRVWRSGDPAYGGYLFHPEVHNGWDNSHMQHDNQGPAGYTVFLGGTPSVEVSRISAEAGMRDTVPESTAESYVNKLDQVFPGFRGAYTGEHKAALWSNNPFVKASYTCYKVGQWSTIAGHEIEPVGQLYFAGEHCSEEFQGFMNGAAQTGRLVAETLIEKLKL